MSWYRWEGDVLWLSLKVQPRAKRNAFTGALGDHFRVQITAPPVDGKANDRLRRLLAETFAVPLSRVELLSGEAGRTKQLRIHAPGLLPGFVPPPPDA